MLEVLAAEELDRGGDRSRRTVAQGAERASEDVVALVEQQVEVVCRTLPRLQALQGLDEPPGSLAARRALAARLVLVDSVHRSTARTTQVVSSNSCRARVPSMEPAAPTPSKSSGTSRWSSVSSGVDEPPGVQNFSGRPPRMPPARSISSRSVMPSGASYWPGLVMWPLSENS